MSSNWNTHYIPFQISTTREILNWLKLIFYTKDTIGVEANDLISKLLETDIEHSNNNGKIIKMS